jgi:glutamate 5-kinase
MTRPAPRRKLLSNVRRVVVKVGSSILAESPVARVRALAADVALLREGGLDVVLLASGALVLGLARLDLRRRPRQQPLLQAASAVGRVVAIRTFEDALSAHRIQAAQVLLTLFDLEQGERFLRARHALMALLDYGVVPVVQENDAAVPTALLPEGDDSDALAARLPRLCEADLLVLLTTAEGVFASSPRGGGEVVTTVTEIEALAAKVLAGVARGRVQRSLASKIQAARRAAGDGVPTVIASGVRPGALTALLDDDSVGTLVLPSRSRRSRKQWIAEVAEPRGAIQISEEARGALLAGPHGLGARAVRAVSGSFEVGDVVRLVTPDGVELARGLSGFGSVELARIAGKEPEENERFYGSKGSGEIVKRDDLVIL